MAGPAIFSVTNVHHVSCGTPPQIDDTVPNRYLGYFENQHGEQAIFVYDRSTKQGTLYMGDAGWGNTYKVINGVAQGLRVNAVEQAWLTVCWKAATH
jgi:hypothetical protein